MKFLSILLIPFVLLAFLVAPVEAVNRTREKPAERMLPQLERPVTRTWQDAQVTLGNPVTLEGKGALNASGNGSIHYTMGRGKVLLHGVGVIAVKGTPTVQFRGFVKKTIGEWTYYVGTGAIRIKGDALGVSVWGRFRTHAHGEGKATFRGSWNVRYHGVGTVASHETLAPLPEEFTDEAGTDATAN